MARGRNPFRAPGAPRADAAPAGIAAALEKALASDRAAALAAAAIGERGEVFIVGGAVRDVLMGGRPKDVDLLARGIPGDELDALLATLPGSSQMTGRDFGVFRFAAAGCEVEIALPRTERSTGDRHTDFEVDYDHTLTVEEDLLRRDFTCNAIAFDIASGRVIDPYGGQRDIADGVLRAVSPRAFLEDPLRILRGLRAHARHGLVPDAQTRQEMAQNASRLEHLTAERIGEEWEKLLETDEPHRGMALARTTGVLPELIRELPASADAADHQATLERAEEALAAAAQTSDDPDLRAAAYLAPLEDLAPGLSGRYLERLLWPKKRARRITQLQQSLAEEPAGDELEARRLLSVLGKEEADAFLVLRATGAGAGSPPAREREAQLVRGVLDAGHATSVRELAVDGQLLMDAGIKAGPGLGAALRGLLDLVITDPAANTRERLLAESAAYRS